MDGRKPRSLPTFWHICRQGVAHRDQGQVLVRAYDLVLPVIRRYVGAVSAKRLPAPSSRPSAAGG